ncbi:hypothetical protein PU02_1311 [Bartonella ancashensis]|uniref:Uncharacterized protein n=1 Tax=Bartonella ancashensis TaxID=1318743 RepID=A0A0M3T3A1_9HYPH|nr:hypothetical protein PU02_1311 [Bartonella ancashensis]
MEMSDNKMEIWDSFFQSFVGIVFLGSLRKLLYYLGFTGLKWFLSNQSF